MKLPLRSSLTMPPATGQHVKLEGGFRNTYLKRSPQVLDNNRPRKPTVLFPRTTASSSPIAKTTSCLIHHDLPLDRLRGFQIVSGRRRRSSSLYRPFRLWRRLSSL